jgi:hypothetical protein
MTNTLVLLISLQEEQRVDSILNVLACHSCHTAPHLVWPDA